MIFISILFCAISCGQRIPTDEKNTSGSDTTTDTSNETETGSSIDDNGVQLVSEGIAQFVIVCTDSAYISPAEYLATTLNAKTGAVFSLQDTVPVKGEAHAMFVGSVDTENYVKAYENISYSGYGAQYVDGDIYLCGYEEATVSKAVQKFTSGILSSNTTVGASGKKNCVIPEKLFFTSSPAYSISSPKLLGKPLSGYGVMFDGDASDAEKAVMQIFWKKTGKYTGCVLTYSSEKDGQIIFSKQTSPNDSYSYSLKSEGSTIRAEYGNLTSMFFAMDALFNAYSADTSSGIDISGSAWDGDSVAKTDVSHIRVMSSNVLMPDPMGGEDLPLAVRAQVLSEYYSLYRPDFIGLQEANTDFKNYIMSDLGSLYSMVESKEVTTKNYTPLLYRSDLYEVIDSKFHQFAVDGCWSYEWALYTSKTDSTVRILHMNLHYHYQSTESRMPGVTEVNLELKRLKTLYPDAVVFVTGDYNCYTTSPEFNAMMSGLDMQSGMLLTEDSDGDRLGHHTLGSVASDLTSHAIDHVSVNPNQVKVIKHRMIFDELVAYATDHCPIFIDVTII